MIQHNGFTTIILTLFAVVGIALVSGCGSPAQPPLSPEQTATGPPAGSNDGGSFVIAFSPDAPGPPQALTKLAASIFTETTSRWFSPNKKGKLKVRFAGKEADQAGILVKEAKFMVEAGSIDREANISMTVASGTSGRFQKFA